MAALSADAVTQSAHLYPQMDSAERAACQSTYTPYVGLLPGR